MKRPARAHVVSLLAAFASIVVVGGGLARTAIVHHVVFNAMSGDARDVA